MLIYVMIERLNNIYANKRYNEVPNTRESALKNLKSILKPFSIDMICDVRLEKSGTLFFKDLETLYEVTYLVGYKQFVIENVIYGGEYRICDKCKDVMDDGYIVYDEYYCSDKCLHEVYPEDVYLNLAEKDCDDVYYTTWY